MLEMEKKILQFILAMDLTNEYIKINSDYRS